MGVAVSALAVLGALAGSAGLSWALERTLLPTAAEAGPASDRREVAPSVARGADRWLKPAGPLVAVAAVALAFVVVPFGPHLIGRDLRIGVFYYIVMLDFVALAVALAGWGAGTANGVEAAYRAIAQLVAYVVPLGLAIVGALMMARTLSTVRVVQAQAQGWYVFYQPVGFLLYVATALMQSYRAPFLEPFAGSLEGGVLGVSSRWSIILWRLALSGLLFLVCAMGATLYLGGWLGPPLLPGWAWLLIKSYAWMAAMLWLGRRIPPLSTAATLALAWKVLIPVGLLNVLLVGGLIMVGVGGAR